MLIRKKAIALVADLIAILLLAGFAFVNFVYFNNISGESFYIEPITRNNIEERFETIKGLKVDRSNSLEDRIAAGVFLSEILHEKTP